MSTKKESDAEKTAAEAQTKTTVRKAAADVMYLGPTIAGEVRHSTVYKGGVLPEKARKCIEEMPMMERLFVPLGETPGAIRELNQTDSVLQVVYTKVAEKFL
ncbi:MAG: hypothetical protein NC541_10980 [bacterium]|nr:hypothetical protein [bacterium]